MPAALRVLFALLIMSMSAPFVHAEGPKGYWKFRFTEQEQTITLLLFFSEDNGKWTGDFVGSTAKLTQEPKFSSVKVKGDSVQFALTFGGKEFVSFDGLLNKEGKKLVGSFSFFGGDLRITELHASQLKKLDDAFEVAREDLAVLETGPELFKAGFSVLEQSAAKKMKPEDVRTIADKIAKVSANYGLKWERSIALRLSNSLASQEGYAEIALAQARRAERMIGDEDPAAVQMQVMQTLATLLAKTGKTDDAKKYIANLAKLEARDAAEYSKEMLKFETPAFAGRKAKSDRVAVVELFTGAECPPCVAADIAFDGTLKTYKPSDVILLQYHFHVPGPDPLTTADSMERVGFYAEAIRGAPTVLVNGKVGPRGGGRINDAKEKYGEFVTAINDELEKAATAKIALSATKDEAGYTAKAVVSDLAKPGEKIMLRFVLIEDTIRYAGGNGIRYHHHVVRALPGGAKGFALTKATHEQSVTIKTAELRETISKYLQNFAKEEAEFPKPDRPLDLKNLKLVALIQDDATKEILQATQIELPTK